MSYTDAPEQKLELAKIQGEFSFRRPLFHFERRSYPGLLVVLRPARGILLRCIHDPFLRPPISQIIHTPAL